jgi:hypothetical protein
VAARLDAVGRPAAARGDRPRAGAGRTRDPRRRAGRLARPGHQPPGDVAVEHAFEFCPRTIALRAGEVVFDGPTRALDAQRLRALYGAQTDELFNGSRLANPTAEPSADGLLAAIQAA